MNEISEKIIEQEIKMQEISEKLSSEDLQTIEEFYRQKFKTSQTVPEKMTEVNTNELKETNGEKETATTPKTKSIIKQKDLFEKKDSFITKLIKKSYNKKADKQKQAVVVSQNEIKKSEERIEKLRQLIADENIQINGLINANSFLLIAKKENKKKIDKIIGLVIEKQNDEIKNRKKRIVQYEKQITALDKTIDKNTVDKKEFDEKVQNYERRLRAIEELKKQGISNPALTVFLSRRSDKIIEAMYPPNCTQSTVLSYFFARCF